MSEDVNVFIVDDTPSNLSLLSGILRGAGHTVRMANSPRRALAMMDALAPELVMLDITMPEMDGYELCRALKERPGTALVPVIFISALAEPLDKVKAFKTGGVDYVTKPFDADEVLARVETQLRLERLRREMDAKNRELAHLNELKNHFIGIAAHDLRTPLTAVIGYSDLMRFHQEEDGRGNAEDREMLEAIGRSGRFMLRLVDDLLDIAAIEAGSVRLDPEPTDLRALARRNVELNAAVAAHKGIGVDLATDGQPLWARVDAVKLEQVLSNLVGNAVKFSPSGSRVRVRLGRREQWATIAVEDDGPGIPARDLERIFEPFQTAGVKGTAGEKSTGLGLAIVKKLVTAHGGEIRARSEVGRGTSIEVSLPREEPPAET
jgi:two-component system sensor histidine kinase/response regulator